jgi:hypothetical protein
VKNPVCDASMGAVIQRESSREWNRRNHVFQFLEPAPVHTELQLRIELELLPLHGPCGPQPDVERHL